MGNRSIGLSFGKGNSKLAKEIAHFSLPAGWSCPSARECLAKADRNTGNLTDGRHSRFRCFSASQEALYPNTRLARWTNFELLRACGSTDTMARLILNSLPDRPVCRIHVAGDFFSKRYFDSWISVARQRSQMVFYAYTKSVDLWIARLNQIPRNLKLVASLGGQHDELALQYGLPTVRVVFSEIEAADLGLPVDHDDSHAIKGDHDFALLLHNVQRHGSAASRARRELLRQGNGGYSVRRKAA